MGPDLCGKWMPRKQTMCARKPGHGGPCKTSEGMERQREYSRTHPHPQSKESRKKSNRKYRISSYGLTQEQFDLILAAQNHACGDCIRGLLCHICNIALGHIERRYAMARAYLDSPRGWLIVARQPEPERVG
jgi:hypothetical protein